jgi:hypothetical protein
MPEDQSPEAPIETRVPGTRETKAAEAVAVVIKTQMIDVLTDDELDGAYKLLQSHMTDLGYQFVSDPETMLRKIIQSAE